MRTSRREKEKKLGKGKGIATKKTLLDTKWSYVNCEISFQCYCNASNTFGYNHKYWNRVFTSHSGQTPKMRSGRIVASKQATNWMRERFTKKGKEVMRRRRRSKERRGEGWWNRMERAMVGRERDTHAERKSDSFGKTYMNPYAYSHRSLSRRVVRFQMKDQFNANFNSYCERRLHRTTKH